MSLDTEHVSLFSKWEFQCSLIPRVSTITSQLLEKRVEGSTNLLL